VQTARAGEVVSLSRGTHVVYEGEEDGTEVVFVTYLQGLDAQRQASQAGMLDDFHPVRGVTRLVPSLGVAPMPIRKGA
jgi:hypothetical protein